MLPLSQEHEILYHEIEWPVGYCGLSLLNDVPSWAPELDRKESLELPTPKSGLFPKPHRQASPSPRVTKDTGVFPPDSHVLSWPLENTKRINFVASLPQLDISDLLFRDSAQLEKNAFHAGSESSQKGSQRHQDTLRSIMQEIKGIANTPPAERNSR